MLKIIRGLFLGFVVLAGSACVTPTHASSASSVLLTYVQVTGVTGAKEELVVLYNPTASPVEMTNWCLSNKSTIFACFDAIDETGASVQHVLAPYGYATIASEEYLAAHELPGAAVSLAYAVTSQSSGSIVGSSDTISLLDETGGVVDSHSWTISVPAGRAWARLQILAGPDMYAVGGSSASDWHVTSTKELPFNMVDVTLGDVEDDSGDGSSPPNSEEGDEGDTTEPDDKTDSAAGERVEVPVLIIITELLANAEGSDEGNEFVELYNSDPDAEHSLDGLLLRVGLESPKWYSFPAGASIPAEGYRVFTNAELGYTLVNTNGGVQLFMGDTALGDRIEYTNPKDDMAWALIDGVWQYTNVPTPGAPNQGSKEENPSEKVAASSESKPCADHQFRNPATGRCKALPVAASPAPCKEGQERNPETNRCRAIATASTPTPCKAGQERNPETNRCRTIVKMSAASYDVKGVQAKAAVQLSWYYWAAILLIVTLVLAYAVWEWRQELLSTWRKIAAFARRG